MPDTITQGKPLPRIERTTSGLKSTLFDMLEGLQNGTMDAEKSNSMCRVVNSLMSVQRMELGMFRAIGEAKAANGVLSLPSANLDGRPQQDVR
jgi:hypothetical protein